MNTTHAVPVTAEQRAAGQGGGDHAWGHDPATTPLYGWLRERGFLDPANPPLRP